MEAILVGMPGAQRCHKDHSSAKNSPYVSRGGRNALARLLLYCDFFPAYRPLSHFLISPLCQHMPFLQSASSSPPSQLSLHLDGPPQHSSLNINVSSSRKLSLIRSCPHNPIAAAMCPFTSAHPQGTPLGPTDLQSTHFCKPAP